MLGDSMFGIRMGFALPSAVRWIRNSPQGLNALCP